MFIETEDRILQHILFFSRWTKNNSNDRYKSMKFELLEFAKSRFMPACVPTCQKRAKFLFLRAKVLYCVPLFYLDVPKCVPIFQLGVPTWQKPCHFSNIFVTKCKCNFPRKISILYYFIKILHFTWYHSYTYHMYMYRK